MHYGDFHREKILLIPPPALIGETLIFFFARVDAIQTKVAGLGENVRL